MDLFGLSAKVDTGAFTSAIHFHHAEVIQKDGKECLLELPKGIYTYEIVLATKEIFKKGSGVVYKQNLLTNINYIHLQAVYYYYQIHANISHDFDLNDVCFLVYIFFFLYMFF